MKAIPKDKKTIVFTDSAVKLASLTYDSRWSEKAVINLANGKQYRIETLGFWKTGFKVIENDKHILSLQQKWSGKVTIEMLLPGLRASYSFTRKGIWKERFELTDKDNFVLGSIISHFRWRSFSTDYELNLNQRFEAQDFHILFAVLMVFIIRSIMSHHTHAIASV